MAGKEYVQIKFSGIDMRVYLEQSPFDETKIPNSAIKIGARQFYELQNKEHYIQMILFSMRKRIHLFHQMRIC